MTFTPKTEKEIQEENLWPAGEYDFEVLKADNAVSGEQSKSPGTKYIKLGVQIFNSEGKNRLVRGMLHPNMAAQLRHFCAVGNLMAKYEAGTLSTEDCVGVAGKLKLRVKEARGNFKADNEIADFVVPKAGEAKETSPIDDDPFA